MNVLRGRLLQFWFAQCSALPFSFRLPASWALSWRAIFVAVSLLYAWQGIEAQRILFGLTSQPVSVEKFWCSMDDIRHVAPFETELERMIRLLNQQRPK